MSTMDLQQAEECLRWVSSVVGESKALEQLSDGVVLLEMVAKLSGKKIGRYYQKPNGRFQKLENINKCIKMMSDVGLENTGNFSPAAIEEGNPKAVVGVLWRLMYHFDLNKKPGEMVFKQMDRRHAESELLSWAQRASGSYVISNFKDSFQDGKALAAILNHLSPGAVEMKEISNLTPLELTRRVMQLTEELYGVKTPSTPESIAAPGGDRAALMLFLSILREQGEKQVVSPAHGRHRRTHSGRHGGSRSGNSSPATRSRSNSTSRRNPNFPARLPNRPSPPKKSPPKRPDPNNPSQGVQPADQDIDALLDYLKDPDRDVSFDFKDGASPSPSDLRHLMDTNGGLVQTMQLLDYLENIEPFQAVPEIITKMPKAKKAQEEQIVLIEQLLQPTQGILLSENPDQKIGREEARALHDEALVGRKTVARLSDICHSKTKFSKMKELAEAVGEAHAAKKKRTRKEKEALKNYLNEATNGLFTAEGNAATRTRQLTKSHVDQLFRVEKSGMGTAATLDTFLKAGMQFFSPVELHVAAEQESKSKRSELAAYLNDPACKAVSPAKRAKFDSSPNALEELVEEGEAGPQTKSLLEILVKEGKSFENVNEMAPWVRVYANIPIGPAGEAVLRCRLHEDDIDKLIDFFSRPDVSLLNGAEDMPQKDLETLLNEEGGYDNVVDLCGYLNKEGFQFGVVLELVPAIRKEARPRRLEVKERMKMILNHWNARLLGKPVTDADVNYLYRSANVGWASGKLLHDLAERGGSYQSLSHLAEALKESSKAFDIKSHAEMGVFSLFLQDPSCPLFTPGVSGREVDYGTVMKMYRIEHSGPGTAVLLDCMARSGRKFDSLPAFLNAAKAYSIGSRNLLRLYLQEQGSAVFKESSINANSVSGPYAVGILHEEGEAGPNTADLIQSFLKENKGLVPFGNLEDAISVLRERRPTNAGAAAQFFQKAMAVQSEGDNGDSSHDNVSEGHLPPPAIVETLQEDLEVLMDYFSSNECTMMDGIADLKPEDLKQLLPGSSVQDTLAICNYLNYRNSSFTSAAALISAVKLARTVSAEQQQQAQLLLSSSNLLPAPLSPSQFQAMHTTSSTGPMLLSLLQNLIDANKRFQSPDELAACLKQRRDTQIAERQLHLEAVKNWLEGKHGSCRLWNKDPKAMGPIPMSAVCKLFAIEQSGYGTAALLHQIQVNGDTFSNTQELLEEATRKSKQRRTEALRKLTQQSPKIFTVPTAVTAKDVTTLCEEASVGPALVGFISSLGLNKKFPKWSDLCQHVRRLYEPVRDPLNVLNLKQPQEQKQTRIFILFDSSMIQTLTQLLTSPSAHIVEDKASINERDLVHLIREGCGFEPTMVMVKHLKALGATYPNLKELIKGIRFELRVQNDVVSRLSDGSCTLMEQHLEPLPMKYTRSSSEQSHPSQMQVLSLWEGAGLGLATLAVIERWQQDGKKFPNIQGLTRHLSHFREEVHAALPALLKQLNCNAPATKHQLNHLLWAGGGSFDDTKVLLKQLHGQSARFVTIVPLIEKIRTMTGTPLML
eukprot:gb/GEZN01000260.1/.p1 GENE.gb/GEZN01000260.1/~~gb/GEZN01000260.1/.p1  ORF type:complete len:1554 (+),score=235.89 gb/GEZN01000260.1/:79-4662(+)